MRPVSNSVTVRLLMLMRFEETLKFPVPEMTFGSNILELANSSVTLKFSAFDALCAVQLSTVHRVAASEEWLHQV